MDLNTTHIDIPGTRNVRDLGGLPVAPGSRVAPGVLFRAEALAFPGAGPIHSIWRDEQRDAYRGLGIDTVIDLRAEGETLSTPSAWQEATGASLVVELPMASGGDGPSTDYVRMLLSGEMARFDVDDMATFYLGTIDEQADTFARAIRIIADHAPVLVHCAAGKDRTGLVVAIVLDILGVPEEVIVDDYAFTGVLRPNRAADYAERFLAAGLDMENVRTLFESPAAAMVATLKHLRKAYGGSERYLIERGDLDPATIARLRRRLLIAADPAPIQSGQLADR